VDGGQVNLKLMNGSMFMEKGGVDRYLTFGEYSFILHADMAGLLRIKSYDTATQPEFRKMIAEKPTPKRIREYHNRYAFPVFNLLLAFVCIAFGIQDPRSPKYTGFIVGMATVIGYYLFQVLGGKLANSGGIDPAFGAWLPNMVFAGFLLGVAIWRSCMSGAMARRIPVRAR